MNIITSTVKQLTITGIPRIDPIRVMVENFEPGKGRITITCWDESWVNYWGAMGGGATIETFFMRASAGYLADKLKPDGMESEVFDADHAEEACRRHVIKDRRQHKITAVEARDLWDRIEFEEFYTDPVANHSILSDVFQDEWWTQIPMKPNQKWLHLLEIVKTVKAAFAQQREQEEVAA